MKKLLISSYSLGIGGVEKKIIDLVTTQDSADTPFSSIRLVLKEHRFPEFSLPKKNKKIAVQFFSEWGWKQYLLLHKFGLFVFFECIIFSPDVCLGFSHQLAAWLTLYKCLFFWRKTRVVYGVDCVTTSTVIEKQLSKKLVVIYNFLSRFIDAHIFQTDFSLKSHAHFFPYAQKSSHILPNWVGVPRAFSSKKKKYDLLLLSRLDEDKQTRLFFSLLKKIPAMSPRCLIMGEGSERQYFEQNISKHPRQQIDLVTASTQGEKACQESAILVSFSQSESMPITFLEAMARGCVVVTLYYPGSELLIAQGQTGFVAKSIREMAEYIETILTDQKLRTKIAKSAYSFVKNNYSIKNKKKYLRLLSENGFRKEGDNASRKE